MAANAAYRVIEMRFEMVSKKIESLSQVVQSDVQAYFQEDVWRSFLNCFFEVFDEEATFTTEFKEAWRTFMSKCLLKMIEEILDDEKELVKISDLDSLTLDYDIYDAEDVLNLNDTALKVLLKKELDNKGRSK
ncbi:hypothetical protein C2G38_2030813 [Gigaspora rosea]|uniref:Uncharacterized protein n=1 Tax=Gigaspora rosea TaxID=44941 RepID=A0A397VT37_9GLOM|nr:hypothetical protein C2G38_2030813 [Gigaspora rosea]